MKVVVIGYSGSGKSTLASWIAEQNQIPLLHLDQIHWMPGWVERPENEERALVKDFMDHHTSWVIDGNYDKLEYERRMKEADYILFLDFPRIRCLFRAWRRVRKYKGKTRDSITEGCIEKLDWEFLMWILWKGRSRKVKKDYRMIMKNNQEKFIRIHTQKELEEEKEKWRKR